ncbi:mitochondrial Rho GTPase 1-like [Alnus glutinosa]|uniref:mitochondrial Rho GTPase 1-like n=1 Tax=Alnus glutinosa TaxID=3517 RepID=UPI002D76EB49|nr:mitochondrial Rho GTPase 1-like [Alnus glutinosa]
MSPIVKQFPEIGCIECSALEQIKIPEVFYYAQNPVLNPIGPLVDQNTQVFRPRFVGALKRIFALCDQDRDGALSDAELNDLQVKCLHKPIQPSDIVDIKSLVAERSPEGVNDRGLTLTGFLFLHAIFIKTGHPETSWTMLRKFGYNNNVKLAEDLIPTAFKRAPDQSVELTNEAKAYLRGIIERRNSHSRCATFLRPQEIFDVFSTAAGRPWEREPYVDAAQKNPFGGWSIDGFLSMWAFATLLDPALSMENMINIGFPGDPSSAFRVTRERRLDRKKQQINRNVFQCFVFGPMKSGKSALLNSFLGRHFRDEYTSTIEDNYAVNVVDEPRGTKKTLVVREIPEGVSKLLLDKESLAACDVAVFVHDSSNSFSWERATELLEAVASHGKDTGFEVPCLIVAAKDDLNSCPMAKQNNIRVSQRMGIKATIPISSKSGDLNNVFRRIASAAEHPLPKLKRRRLA